MSAPAVQPQKPLVRDVLLRDGSTLRLQAPTPVDFEDIKAFYDGLSLESRHFRFHGFGRTDTVARADADASGVDRLALIGRHDGRVVAVACYVGLREPGVAEVAFAVADDDQRRGIGMRMLEQLAALAADRGIRRFDAEVMANNRPMLGVFEHAGFAVRREGFGELTVWLDITPTEAVLERIDERDHVAAVASLRAIFAPSSVAVVGAAATPGNVGRAVLANIIAGGFEGVVIPVNRDGGVVCSIRAACGLGELEVAPELVIIAAAGDEVLEFAAEAAEKGARALLVLPPGSAHEGEASPAREERLLEIVRGAGMRMVGPSSLGVLNTAAEVSLNATFTGASVRAGALAIGSPSGAVGIGLLGHASARQLGVSMFVSLGNRADVSTNDLLECWEQDDRTAAVILYVESFGNPERFTRIARRVSRIKPILVVKGRRRAERVLSEARSHTAAALRGDAVIDALLQQAGVLRFRSGEELFNAAEFFERQPLPSGRRIGIVSNSAGVATLAADACATRGLEIREASEAQNPLLVGITAGPERIRCEHPRAARRCRHRCADGLLHRVLRRRPGSRAGGDLRGLGGAAQAGCGIGAAVRWPVARADRHGRAELPVPRVVSRRARARGRTSRVALAAARRAARTIATSTGRRRARRSLHFLIASPPAAGFRSPRRKRCWPRTGSRLPPRITAAISSGRLRWRRKSAIRSR